MKQKQFAMMALLGLGLVAVGVFQNCSKVDFAQTSAAIAKADNSNVTASGADPSTTDPTPPAPVDTATICSAAKASIAGQKPQSIDHIDGVSGDATYYVSDVGDITGVSGHIVVVGQAGATARRVSGISGSATFCDVSIGWLNGASGDSLYVDNGDIKEIHGFSGNLDLINGDIGVINGMSGTISITGGKVLGSQNGVTGQISLK